MFLIEKELPMFQIRQAVPIDVEKCSRLIDMSGCTGDITIYQLMFPGKLKTRLNKIGWLFLNGERIFNHHTKYKIAENDGEIVGTLSTSNHEYFKTWAWRNTLLEMGYSDMKSLSLAWRLLPYFLVNPSIPKHTLIIENVATFPDFRRQGVVLTLLEAVIEEGRKENYKKIQVSTFIGNISAQRAYEKVGFQVKDEYTGKLFKKVFGKPGMMRLTLNL